MERQQKPPKKKNRDREQDPSAKNRHTAAAPEAQERVDESARTSPEGENASKADAPSREEVVTNWSKPVTNQDEQDKITNAGEGDIPIANK